MTLNVLLFNWEKHHGFWPSRSALEQGGMTPETLKHKHPPCICITYPPENHHEPPKVVVCRCFSVSHAAFSGFSRLVGVHVFLQSLIFHSNLQSWPKQCMYETFADEKWQHEQWGYIYICKYFHPIEHLGGFGGISFFELLSTNGKLVVWGLVVWDFSRGTLRIKIQFTSSPGGSNRNPSHRAPHHQALPLSETSKWYEFNWICPSPSKASDGSAENGYHSKG